ncbi:DUF1236 domain-containing protein [Sinorhizobium numidicum]|uniref:DUF1236 domain-containing protein n=1 Tax=Sinorhizobium numidicum TaxID=680248 RepID=A0ABY8CS18_9HYPH|nr:DUF1236 domain-containing protein [Sinorhizobium numidicum]WEX74267.1 DUF1236 domain-containing protein [Sinorhizobium numidicum]WEX80252.1 DUF1236 domain-containing protein [Sinorhizobium numidicum]
MNAKLLVLSAALLGSMTVAATAQDTSRRSAVTGAAGGAVTGAIIGGPVGAAVGGVAGAIAGTAIDPPPAPVIAYVQAQPAPPQPVVIQEQVVVGKRLPQTVVLNPIPEDTRYAYAVVNQQRVIVDPQTRTVVQIVQ